MLLGNAKGPYQRQIEETKSILKNKEEIKEQIADLLSEIPSNMKKIQHLNIADFRLKYIDFSQNEGIIHELSYESEDGEYFGAVFKDQVIKDILIQATQLLYFLYALCMIKYILKHFTY